MKTSPNVTPRVSIVIPVFNAVSYTRACLRTLMQHTNVPCEVLVIDNASTDQTPSFLSALCTEGTMVTALRVVRNSRNLGFAKACNQGFLQAQGRTIIFLNNDTLVTPNWLEPLVGCFADDSQAGMVTPTLLYPRTNLIQYAGVAYLPNALPCILQYRSQNNPWKNQAPREVPGAGGACMAIERDVLENVGLFDEGFINGLEDIDLSLRIKKAGYKNILCPKSIVYHHESKTEGRKKYDERNIQYYLRKWRDKVTVTHTGEVLFHESRVSRSTGYKHKT